MSSLEKQDHPVLNVAAPSARPSPLVTMLKNSLANLSRLGSGWVLVLVVPPFLTRHLPKATYSTWMLILQLAAYVTLVQGGIELSVSRYVARADRTGEEEHIRQILGAAGLLLGLFGLLLTVTALGASWKFDRLFPEVPASLLEGARYALLIVGLAYSLNLPFSILSGLFQGYQKFEVTAVAASVSKLTTAIGVIWTAVHGGSLIIMALWAAIGPFLQSLVLWGWWRGGESSGFGPQRPGLQAVRQFFGFCLTILIVQFTMVLIAGLDLPIVAAFDFASAGYYAAATAAASIFSVPSTAIISTFLPVASGIVATKRPREVGAVLTRATRYSTAMLCTIAFPLTTFMFPVLKLWIGASYAEHTTLLAVTLVAAQFVRLTLFPYTIIGFSAGQQGRMLASPVIEGIVNVVVSLVAVRIWGAWGVAFGTLVGAVVGITVHFLVSMPATDSVHVDRLAFLARTMIRPLLISLPATLAALLVAPQLKELPLQLLAMVVLALAIAATHLRWTLSAGERSELRDIVARCTGKLGILSSPA